MYIVSELAFPSARFLRQNVLCFCLDEDAISLDGQSPPGPIIGNSFNSLPQQYDKHEGTIVLVQLYGGAWWRLMGIDPARFDVIKPLGDADCEGLEAVLEALRNLRGDYAGIAARLDRFFTGLLETAKPRGLAERVRAEIALDLGASVAEIADRIGCSERQAQRALRKTYGVSPSHLKRIFKLTKSRTQGRGLEIDWLHVPADVHYADQSHWIKEFRKLQGITPSEYSQHPLGRWLYYERGAQHPLAEDIDVFDQSPDWLAHNKAGSIEHDLALR